MNIASADRLAQLYRISQTFNSSLDLDEVLNRVMDEVVAATGAERGFLLLHEGEQPVRFRASRGLDQRTIEAPEFQVSRTVIERVLHDGQPCLTSDARQEDWLASRASVVGLNLRSILCVPLQLKGKLLGEIYVDNRLQRGIFTKDHLDFVTAIASSAVIAIENARLYQVAVEKGRMERELQLARQVQRSLIPHQPPELPGWDFAAQWLPARVVSGDFYDFILTSDGKLGVVIADVSDKGMPAALFMALSRSILRGSITSRHSPAECILKANRLVCADAADGMFITLLYGLLDPETGEFTYVNAGHNPPLLVRAGQEELLELSRTGMVLGFDASCVFEQQTVYLGPGDFMLLYTDGVTDATDAANQQFGKDRLYQVVRDHRRAGPVELVGALENAIRTFMGGIDLFDDITCVVVQRVGT